MSDRSHQIAAVVLAAGASTRMGQVKGLLEFGGTSALGRVVGSLGRTGIGDIVVVTGEHRDLLAPEIDRLGVRGVHNPEHHLGMFSSVKAGVAALADDVEGFFILPVDCPLVRPSVFETLMGEFVKEHSDVAHPTCCGLRGHPPLVAARLAGALLGADTGGHLRGFFARGSVVEIEVDVGDPTILMDMDTPDDYATLHRFAEIIDEAGGARGEAAVDSGVGQGGTSGGIRPEDAHYLLAVLKTPDNVVAHCRAVAAVGEAVALAVSPCHPHLDVGLVRSACLLHDIVRPLPRHAVVGRELLTAMGLPELAAVVGEHMVPPPHRLETPGVTESEIVYLSDKLVAEDRIVGIDERESRALSSVPAGSPSAARIKARIQTARSIREKVEVVVGRHLDDIIGRVTEGADLS